MYKHEKIAQETGNLFGGKTAPKYRMRKSHDRNIQNSSILDFLFPIGTLSVSVIGGLLYSGDFYLFGGQRSFMQALQSANAALSLFIAGIAMTTISLIYFLIRRKLHVHEIFSVCKEGIMLMAPSVLVLLLAWTFGDILREELRTGHYLAGLFTGSVREYLLPTMFFIASTLTSFSIGSAWGTMAIMFPIAIPMVISFLQQTVPVQPDQLSMLFPVLGAILSGGVLGDHVSPISDSTIMSSTGTGSYHIDHVETQLMYSMPPLIATGTAFIVAGLLIKATWYTSALISLTIGLTISFSTFTFINYLRKRKEGKNKLL
jgi:Na+/H+ antiporter NhaC